jgi:purine-cytosine permease-like protein
MNYIGRDNKMNNITPKVAGAVIFTAVLASFIGNTLFGLEINELFKCFGVTPVVSLAIFIAMLLVILVFSILKNKQRNR